MSCDSRLGARKEQANMLRVGYGGREKEQEPLMTPLGYCTGAGLTASSLLVKG